MGLLLYSLSLLALTLSFPLNVVSVLFVSLSALTHKLSLQTLFFVVLGYSIFDATASLHFTLRFLLAFVISKLKYIRIFRFHLSYVKSMMENPKARHPNKEYLMLANVPYAFLAPLAIVILLPDILSKRLLDSFSMSVVSFRYQPVGRLLTVWAIVPFLLVFFWRRGIQIDILHIVLFP